MSQNQNRIRRRKSFYGGGIKKLNHYVNKLQDEISEINPTINLNKYFEQLKNEIDHINDKIEIYKDSIKTTQKDREKLQDDIMQMHNELKYCRQIIRKPKNRDIIRVQRTGYVRNLK